MNVVNIILVALGVITVSILIVALFSRKKYFVRREIVIDSAREKVFDYLKQLKNQDYFNKWVMVDAGMKREFIGTDGTEGFIYRWNGDKKIGEGEQEIKSLTEGTKIETEIRFVRPFPAIAYANFVIEAVSDGQTKVIWSNASAMKYPMNIMVPMVEKMLAKDMDISLYNLKSILEK